MKKNNYETPIIEVMNARVESGFAGSGYGNGQDTELEHIHGGAIINETDFD